MNCMICGDSFYRRRSYIKRGIRKTCGKTECKSGSMRGANNPFWGKSHSAEVREKIKQGRARNPPKNTGPRKGSFRHTPEARAKIAAASRELWRLNRDKMLACNPRPPLKPREELRYRRNFTEVQRKLWKESKCSWCESVDQLVLDHIIPVMCGGENVRANAQTLCQPCNRWKLWHVDRPLFLAGFRQPKGPESTQSSA